MEMIWQIKIDTRTADGKTIDTQWFDRFKYSADADTFVREFCKLNPEWELSGDYEDYAIKRNTDGSYYYMRAYGQILFDDWMGYITSDYRECKAKFDTTDICYDGSNI